jgi:hypothetical protein
MSAGITIKIYLKGFCVCSFIHILKYLVSTYQSPTALGTEITGGNKMCFPEASISPGRKAGKQNN